MYAYDRVQFGDEVASLLLELARKLLATEFAGIDPLAAKHLKRNGYIDDIVTGGTLEDALRIKGKWNGDTWDGTMNQRLKQAGFKAKYMVIGGKCTPEEAEELGNKFLGVGYDVVTDTLRPQVTPKMQMSTKQTRKAEVTENVDETLVEETGTIRKISPGGQF